MQSLIHYINELKIFIPDPEMDTLNLNPWKTVKDIKESEIHLNIIKVKNLLNDTEYSYNWASHDEYEKEVESGEIHQPMGGKNLSDYQIEQKHLLTSEGGNYSITLNEKKLQKIEKFIKEIKSLNLQDSMSILSLLNQVISYKNKIDLAKKIKL